MVAPTTIVEQRLVGSDRQLEGFCRAERQRLYGALEIALGDADLARDAVDEAFTRAYQRWRRVGRYDNPGAWVYRVAFNWGVSRHRTRRRIARWPPPQEPGAEDREPADGTLEAALAALPAAQRSVVVLRFHLDWQVDQIAAALEVPAGTVKSRLHRGLAALRAELGEQEEDA